MGDWVISVKLECFDMTVPKDVDLDKGRFKAKAR
jgi:hypothetical protein